MLIFSSLSNIASSRFDVAVCGSFVATADDDDDEFQREIDLRRDEDRCFRGISSDDVIVAVVDLGGCCGCCG